MKAIYRMGFDAWGKGITKKEYLHSCIISEKYKLGDWYCLEKNNELVSSIIIYRSGFSLAENYCGFGSISTSPTYRGKGYADHLIAKCITSLEQKKYLGIFLFSEVGNTLYRKHGFCGVRNHEKEGLMFLSINGGNQPTAPSYF